VVVAIQHLQDRAGQFQSALNRLVGVGVGPKGQCLGLIAGLAQFLFQQFGNVGLVDQLGLEIEAGGIAEIGVGRAGEAVNAAVLTPAVRVDGAVEADVGRGVPTDRGFGRIAGQCGVEA
jgi:hypothetical protein